jgi:tRNA(fMet)-specific endonuclease VapC
VSLILDTDHCVAILRGNLDVTRHISPETTIHITATTVGELVYGAFKSVRPEHHLDQVRRLIGGVTVLPYDRDAGFLFGELKNHLRTQGTPVAEPDLQIASIAIVNELPLATHNQRHFHRIPGLILQDWLDG